MIVINPSTRQFVIPGADLVFGVEDDSGAERKYFQCPRFVGNNVDIASSFVRINYRNANGETDAHLIDDLTVDGDNVLFSWELHPKVTMYKGQIGFVMCVTGPDLKVKWHTTLGRGQVLEGLEPDESIIEASTNDVISQLVAMVESQTAAVEAVGAEQVEVVKAAADAAEAASVAEIEAKGANTLAGIPEDYTALSEAVDALAQSKGAAIVCEATGSAVAVHDASDVAVQSLRLFGKSTQDGVPSPDAPVEIVSVESPVVTVGGKNLLPPTTGTISAQGMTSSPATDGTVLLNGTATQEISRVVSQNFLLPPGKYTLSVTGINTVDGNKDRVYLNAADGSGTIVNYVMVGKPMTFEMTSGTIVRVAIVFAPNSTYDNEVAYIQLESGDTATAYEPYKPLQTIETTYTLRGIPVTAGGNYTDENGQQWICDEVDFERGVLVQRVGVNNEVEITDSSILSNGLAYGVWNVSDKRSVSRIGLLSSVARYVTSSRAAENTCYENPANVVFVGSATDTFETLREKYNGSTILYTLRDPIEKPLSETEIAAYRAMQTYKPNTTVLSGTDVAVEYVADTKLYIDNKIAALIGG